MRYFARLSAQRSVMRHPPPHRDARAPPGLSPRSTRSSREGHQVAMAEEDRVVLPMEQAHEPVPQRGRGHDASQTRIALQRLQRVAACVLQSTLTRRRIPGRRESRVQHEERILRLARRGAGEVACHGGHLVEPVEENREHAPRAAPRAPDRRTVPRDRPRAPGRGAHSSASASNARRCRRSKRVDRLVAGGGDSSTSTRARASTAARSSRVSTRSRPARRRSARRGAASPHAIENGSPPSRGSVSMRR